jgi:hypothetical protein
MKLWPLLPRLAVLAVGAAAVMCELNPQPLPPLEAAGDRDAFDGSAFAGDAGGRLNGDGGAGGAEPTAPTVDPDAGDAGDAGDASFDGPG